MLVSPLANGVGGVKACQNGNFELRPSPRNFCQLSKKSEKIAALIAACEGKSHDAHYLGYFECFNQQLFYEAHDVLEELWLTQRRTANDGFYKGLIQLAGAFVHLQKNRLGPAAALFKLSQKYLSPYPPFHAAPNITSVRLLIDDWLAALENPDFSENPLKHLKPPTLMIKRL